MIRNELRSNFEAIRNGYATKAAEAIAERMDRELLGAWRAGYNYVHVYDPLPSAWEPGDTFTVSQYVLPAYAERPPEPDGVVYRYTYDLTDVTRADLESAGAL